MPKWLKVLITVAAMAVAVLITLLVAARLAGYSFSGLIAYLADYLEYIWTEHIMGG